MVSQQLLSLNPTTDLVVLLLGLWLLLGCDNSIYKGTSKQFSGQTLAPKSDNVGPKKSQNESKVGKK